MRSSILVASTAFLLLACENPGPKTTTATAAPSATTAPMVATVAPTATATATTTPSAPPTDIPAPADVAAPPADAEKTPSGLASKVLEKGTGDKRPKPEDQALVHYTGWTKDGVMFDSSVVRGEPITLPLSGVIPGWTEGLQLMTVKEKRRFWIPGSLAYGDRPMQPGAPAGQLTFDIELLEIKEAPPPPPVPTDVAKPPKDAKKTPSGLAYKVLTPGKGEKPTAADTVVVHYSGWSKDGKMFDSSVTRGEPARFPLRGVIKGWTEGVQLMQVGEKTRFWIPADLAYGDTPKRPGAPSGQLTFDIELLEVQKR